MMNAKETIKNNILVAMRIYIDSTTMQILEAVISKALFAFDNTDLSGLCGGGVIDFFKIFAILY